MTAPRLIRLQDTPSAPWRNGGGTTRELLAWPAPPAAWQLRVSVAEIAADGPFSAFPGVQRWFAVLKGAGVELSIDGRARRVSREDEPLCFAGDAAASCRLVDGPTLDLNLMLRGVPGRLLPAVDGERWQPRSAQCGLFSAVAGRCDAAATNAVEVPAYALLWFQQAPASLAFEASQRPAVATGWWLEAA